MVRHSQARLDASFAALSDATRRGVLEQLGRADASIIERYRQTVNGPARLVFEAWTKPELFKRWWVPKSVDMEHAGRR